MAMLFRSSAALAAWSGLLLQYYLVARSNNGHALLLASLNFFSFFTIQSNILVALSLTVPWLWPGSARARFWELPATRGAVMLYITVTGLIYFLLLRHLPLTRGPEPQELPWLANALLHYATPILFGLGWLLFSPKGMLKWSSALIWLIFPLLYGGYILLIRGPLSGFYPYPFIDVATLGVARVLWNMAALLVFFLVLALLLVAINRWLGRPSQPTVELAG